VGSYEHKNEGMSSMMVVVVIMMVMVVVVVVVMMMMMMENFQPAEWLLASQGVCSMKFVTSTNTEIQLHSTSQLIKFVHQEFWNMFHTKCSKLSILTKEFAFHIKLIFLCWLI
jgi:ABC-type lipoprotein release transport system permease subunit